MQDDRLIEAIDRSSAVELVHPESWAEVKEYYQEKYPQRTWIGKLVTDMTGYTPSDGKKYTTARRKVERWNDGTTRPGKAAKIDLVTLGKGLPPERKVKKSSITVHIRGTIIVSKKGRYRDITVPMDGPAAYEFLNDPSYEAIFEEYGVDGDTFAQGMESDVKVSIT